MFGAMTNVALGAGIKLAVNVVNGIMAGRREEKQTMLLRDKTSLEAQIALVKAQSNDTFTKVTRRILFFTLTGTYCWLLIWYSANPEITYDVLVPKTPGTGSMLSFIFGGRDKVEFDTIQLSGGLLLYQFQHVVQMVIGFYCVPSRQR